MKSLIFICSHALLDHLLNASATMIAAPASIALPPSRALEAMIAIFTLEKAEIIMLNCLCDLKHLLLLMHFIEGFVNHFSISM